MLTLNRERRINAIDSLSMVAESLKPVVVDTNPDDDGGAIGLFFFSAFGGVVWQVSRLLGRWYLGT
jgi:hypothetical protein